MTIQKTRSVHTIPDNKPLSSLARFGYALGSAAYGVKENGLLYFLLLFYTVVMGLPPHWVGGALAFALVIDAISDPAIGYMSDRWHSSWGWGRRHPFMYAAALPMAVAYAFLWNPPALSQTGLVIWLVIFVVSIRLLSTVYEVPNAALGPELTSNYDERTKIMSYRTAAATFGGLTIAFFNWHWFLVPSFFAPDRKFLDPEGYAIMGYTGALFILIATLGSALLMHRYIPQLLKPVSHHKSLKQHFADVWSILCNRSLLALLSGASFISIGFGVKATMALFLFSYFWQIPSTSIKFIIYADLIATTIALFFPVKMSLHWGKKKAAIIVGLLTALIVPLSVFLHLLGLFPSIPLFSNPFLAILLLFEVASIALILSSRALLVALMTDLIEDTQKNTKERFEGFIFSINTFVLKAATGLGTFVGSLILAFSGFTKSIKPGDSTPEVMVVLNSTGKYYVLAFVFFYLLGLVFLSLYAIDKRKHEITIKDLSKKETMSPQSA